MNDEIKDKEHGQKVIDAFVNSNIELFAGEENFFCMDRFNNKIFCRQKTYFISYLKDP